jgi:hypothetical protein
MIAEEAGRYKMDVVASKKYVGKAKAQLGN